MSTPARSLPFGSSETFTERRSDQEDYSQIPPGDDSWDI
jgi:hypothetical protein